MQETVAAYRTTLTVASRDPQLRARILVLGPTELCPAELPHPPEPVQSDGTEGTVGMTPDELTVCAYRRVEQGGPVAVSYAAEADEAATTYDAIVHGPHQRLRCASPDPGFEWVVLRFAGRGGFGSERVFHEMVVHTGGPSCPRVQLTSAGRRARSGHGRALGGRRHPGGGLRPTGGRVR